MVRDSSGYEYQHCYAMRPTDCKEYVSITGKYYNTEKGYTETVLLPCPFCGNNPIRSTYGVGRSARCGTLSCPASYVCVSYPVWNKRMPQPHSNISAMLHSIRVSLGFPAAEDAILKWLEGCSVEGVERLCITLEDYLQNRREAEGVDNESD